MNGADLLVACLEHAGIERIYGVPGEETTDLMIAIKHSEIKFILTRHEQAAAFMASAYGRITGKPAVCLATLGPGATNLATGVVDATLDYVPMIVLSGQASRSRMGLTESHQVIDLVRFFEPITKRSVGLLQTSDIPGTVAEAVRLSTAPRPGAVHICVPEDIAGAQADGAPVDLPQVSQPHVQPGMIGQAVAALKTAKKPLVVAGAGVIRHGVASAVAALCENANIPLGTSFMAKGVLPADHRLNAGTFGQPIEMPLDTFIETSDMIITVGLDPVEFSPRRLRQGDVSEVIVIDSLAPTGDVGWGQALALVGDPAYTLTALTVGMDGVTFGDRSTERLQAEPAAEFSPARVFAAVDAALPSNALVFSGVGTHKLEIAHGLPAKGPGQLIIANGSAGMGLALPGAIAASELDPERPVLAICGDGDLFMNLQDMETAARIRSAPIVLVWEDGGYGLIERKEEAERAEASDLSFGKVDWRALAKGFGWHHEAPRDCDDLQRRLADAIAHRKPTLMVIPIDYASGDIAPKLVDAAE